MDPIRKSSLLAKYRNVTLFLSLIGLALSYYTIHVAQQKFKDPSYKAICDISERFSCSPVFTSAFGTGFGVLENIVGKDSILSPLNQLNGVYGYVLYAKLIICALFQHRFIAKIQLLVAICGGIASTYGFINAFWISPHLCLVCLTMHSTNYILLAITVLKLRTISQVTKVDGKKKRK